MANPCDRKDFLLGVRWVIEFHAVEDLPLGEDCAAFPRMSVVASALGMHILDTPQDRVLDLVFFQEQTRALFVVAAVMTHPMFTEDCFAKTGVPLFVFSLVALVVSSVFSFQSLESVGRGSQANDGFS